MSAAKLTEAIDLVVELNEKSMEETGGSSFSIETNRDEIWFRHGGTVFWNSDEHRLAPLKESVLEAFTDHLREVTEVHAAVRGL